MTQSSEDTIAVRISKVLADRIIAGTLEPGTRLRQDHIAAEFGASHVPVREAFRRLEAQGLAVSEPRRGVRVASFSRDEVREVAEMRAVLEELALRHAAPNLTTAILDTAERATRAGDKSGDVRSWEAANRAFLFALGEQDRRSQDAVGLREARVRRFPTDDDRFLAQLAVERRDLRDHREAQRLLGVFLGEDPGVERVDDEHQHHPGQRTEGQADDRAEERVELDRAADAR